MTHFLYTVQLTTESPKWQLIATTSVLQHRSRRQRGHFRWLLSSLTWQQKLYTFSNVLTMYRPTLTTLYTGTASKSNTPLKLVKSTSLAVAITHTMYAQYAAIGQSQTSTHLAVDRCLFRCVHMTTFKHHSGLLQRLLSSEMLQPSALLYNLLIT